jgi:hypothetical protein
MRIIFTIIPILLLAACDKADGTAAAAPAKGTPANAAGLLDRWREAGLEVTAFDPADGERYGGGECKAGQVNGVDAVICLYASPEAAAEAQAAGLAAVGAATGASLVVGKQLLVVTDRRAVDPEGRTINQATRIFRGR